MVLRTCQLHSDGLQQSILYTRQCVLVSQHSQILRLGLELLVRIRTWSEHLRPSSRAHLSHLLRRLTRRCTQ